MSVQQLALWDRAAEVASLSTSSRVAVNVGSDDRLRTFAAAHRATPARVVGILLDLLGDPQVAAAVVARLHAQDRQV